jgi:hypothetical protein
MSGAENVAKGDTPVRPTIMLFERVGPNMPREYAYCRQKALEALKELGFDPDEWDIEMRGELVIGGVRRQFYATRRP